MPVEKNQTKPIQKNKQTNNFIKYFTSFFNLQRTNDNVSLVLQISYQI